MLLLAGVQQLLVISGNVAAGWCSTASGNVHRCCCWLVLQHQPAATSADSCSYSDMLLMIDENIARNM